MTASPKLNQSEQTLLLRAIASSKPGQYRYGKVFADTLEKKRDYNAALTLRERGLVSGEVEYYHINGQPCGHFGHVWTRGRSGNRFSGQLTETGLALALQLKATQASTAAGEVG